MKNATKQHIEKIKSKDGFICDMDGVIYHGNKVLDGVVEFVAWLKANNKKFLFCLRYCISLFRIS